jgi:hypothetical protein
MALVLEPDPVT